MRWRVSPRSNGRRGPCQAGGVRPRGYTMGTRSRSSTACLQTVQIGAGDACDLGRGLARSAWSRPGWSGRVARLWPDHESRYESSSRLWNASEIGVEIGALERSTAAAFIAAGLVSALVFPAGGLTLLRRAPRGPGAEGPRRPRTVASSGGWFRGDLDAGVVVG